MANHISIPNFDYKKPITILITLFAVAFLAILGGIASGKIDLEKYSMLLIAFLINIWLSGMLLAYDRYLYIEFQRNNRVWTMRTDDDYDDYKERSLLIFMVALLINIFITIFAIAFTVVNL